MAMTLYKARGRVRDVKNNATQNSVDGWLNRAIRNVIDYRNWSDLLSVSVINFPNQFSSGTVSMVPGTQLVNGVLNGWPTNDAVNTTLAADVVDSPGIQEVYPSQMANINVGDFLLVDQGFGSQEVITVLSVGPNLITANCRFTHAAGATVTRSSLAGMQFFIPSSVIYTVKAILSATQLAIDQTYGGPPQNNVSYSIYRGYVSITPTARKLFLCWDAIQGKEIGTMRQIGWLNAVDPQRTDVSNSNPLELVQTYPSQAGSMQWEAYPRVLSQYQLGVIYQEGWPELVQDEDVFPWFINPEIFIASACSDALSTKVIKESMRNDPYYDPAGAKRWGDEYREGLEAAAQSDQGRFLTYLKSYREQMIGAGSNYNWFRSHAVAAPGFGWGMGF